MWINKYTFIDLKQRLASAERSVEMGREAISLLQRDSKADRELINALHRSIDTLHERLIEAEGVSRGSKALADALILRQNQLQDERDQLFTKLFNPEHKVAIMTPRIAREPVTMPPGVDFEDIGDDNAARGGYDLSLRGEELTGLLGQVYDPAAEAAGSPTDVGFVPPPEPPGFSS